MMRCPDCGQEWQTNYCPACKKTFQENTETSESNSQSDAANGTEEEGPIEPVLVSTENDQQDQDYKFCVQCGQKLVTSANFCWKCGTSTSHVAPALQTSDRPGNKGTLSEASASLTVSLVGFLLCFCCIGALLEPVALYLGIKALHTLKEDPGYTGHGLAIAGIAISSILILFTLLVLILAITGDLRYYESF